MSDFIYYAKANVAYWHKNRLELEQTYKGKYVLISDQRIVDANESAEQLEKRAKGLEHDIIVACGFIPTRKKAHVSDLFLHLKPPRRNT